eukprot:GFYU01005661.1.p1 GENE.GFYU01005661.1~~GFYU01005661.1.p1  ORF type:complete len:335 (-),score=75.79 GFYU01005661.1:186-1190(-)
MSGSTLQVTSTYTLKRSPSTSPRLKRSPSVPAAAGMVRSVVNKHIPEISKIVYGTVGINSMPLYLQDNPFILTSYRKLVTTYSSCLLSCFFIHNETANIWSALSLAGLNFGLCLFALYNITLVSNVFSTAAFVGFLAHGLLRTFGWLFSFGMHTFKNCTKGTRDFWMTLDYVGIYMAFIGMGSNAVYLELYCAPDALRNSLLFMGNMCALLAMRMSFSDEFRGQRWGIVVRAAVFIVVVFAFCGPIMAVSLLRPRMHHSWLIALVLSEVLGGACYVLRFPERWFPRTFDIWANSHVLWHYGNFGFDAGIFIFSYQCLTQLAAHDFECTAPEIAW